MAKVINFKPIPALRGTIYLSVYPPNTFCNNKEYKVFVGGCGVADAKTLAKAKELLLLHAKRYCSRQINEGLARITHYQDQLMRLFEEGLQKNGPS